MSVEEKDKKIADLRNLLSLARNKIEELKNNNAMKDKQIGEQKLQFEKRTKDLEGQKVQIMKQYEERLLRYQQSLEQSDNLVSKYQAQAITNSKTNQDTSRVLTQIGNITMRIFTLTKVKDSTQAVEQLCNLEKCKQFSEEIKKIEKNQDVEPIIKSTLKLSQLLSQALSRKRELRLIFGKKETTINRAMQEQQEKAKEFEKKNLELNGTLKKMEEEWQHKINDLTKNKAKQSEEKANLEFIKQLLLKIFIGPKQAALMALQVLSRVLKMTKQEVQTCVKKLK